jgi:CheY-like chemotaxis protein
LFFLKRRRGGLTGLPTFHDSLSIASAMSYRIMNNYGSSALPLFDEIRVLARQVEHYVRTAERNPDPAYNIRLAIKCAESLRASTEELYRGANNRQRTVDMLSQADCETEPPCRIHWSPSQHRPHPTGPAVPAGIPVYNASGPGELLLLVEDETELAELVAEMLGGQGFRVILTPTGQEALQIYKDIGSSIELSIINYFLPDMRGDDLFAQLLQIDPAVNVMLASGLLSHHVGAMDTVERLQSKGIRGFIAKPYTRSLLVDAVRSCLRQREKGRHNAYLKRETQLCLTGKDVLGHDFGSQTVDQIPTVPAETYAGLADVADDGFWAPFNP